MNFEIEDINSICRVCMKSGDLQSIFKFKDRFHKEYDDLSRKLSLCGGIDIHINDCLPHKICDVCSDTLILAYDLKILCKTTDAFLKNIIYKNDQEQNSSVELNSHRKSNKTIFKDIKQTKTFPLKKENDSHEEFLNSTKGIDRNYEDTSLNNDSAANSDIQMEDEINVNLQSEKLDPLDAMEKEGGSKKYKCYACEKFLPTRWDRQLHEDLECHLMPPGTIYKCRICPATAPDRDKFDNHIWLHHRGTSPPAKNLPNVTKPVMEIKKINVEKTHQDIICEQCGMQIKNMQTFKIHCLRHKGKSWFNCKQCSFMSTNRHSYNIHMKYNHLGHELLKCPHCTFTTHRKGNLDVHLRRHTGERPYPCNMCDYKAINHSNWKRHMITHTNYRGFECKICGKLYSSNKVLKTHIMRIHEHVKIFHCKPCHTKYVGEEALNRHLQRKHNTTGDSPAQMCHK